MLFAAAGLATAGTVAHCLPAALSALPSLQPAFGIRSRLGHPGAVALTFDDGPHPLATPRLLDLLAAAGVRATFFPTGEQVERRWKLAEEIVAAGHQVGIHGYRHQMMLRLTPAQVMDDVVRAVDVIGSLLGEPPRLYRPPRGIFSLCGLATVRRLGLNPVLWSADGRDWRAAATPASIAGRIAAGLHGGDVILLHDADFYSAPGSWRRTLEAVPMVLKTLQEKRYEAVLV